MYCRTRQLSVCHSYKASHPVAGDAVLPVTVTAVVGTVTARSVGSIQYGIKQLFSALVFILKKVY